MPSGKVLRTDFTTFDHSVYPTMPVPIEAMDLWNEYAQDQISEELISFNEFLNTYFFLSPEATNSDGQWESHPWQRGVGFCMGSLDIIELHIKKPAQCGLTQMLKALCGYECAMRRRSMCVVQPNQGFARWFSKLQLKTLIRDCPIVKKQMHGDPDKTNDPNNTADMRLFRSGSTLYTRGAQTASDLRGFSVATIGVDEIDATDNDIDGQGSADALAYLRIKEASRPKLITQSSPTVEGSSRIEELVVKTPRNARMTYWIKCPCCDAPYQRLQFGEDSTKFGLVWDEVYTDEFDMDGEHTLDLEATAETVRYKCVHNGCTFDHTEFMDVVDETGRWQSTEYYIDVHDECFRSLSDDAIVPAPKRVAIEITGLISYKITWGRAVYDYLSAVDAAKAGNPADLKGFQNGYLGIVSVPLRNENLATWEELKSRARKFRHLPPWVQVITIGMDVGKDHIVYEVIGWGPDYESISLKRRRIDCRPMRDKSILKTIRKIENEEYLMESGHAMKPRIAMIDSRHATDQVLAACAKNPHKRIPVQGTGKIGTVPVRLLDTPDKVYNVHKCTLGTQTLADTIGELLAIKLPKGEKRAAGFAHFRKTEWHDGKYYKELCGETLQAKVEKGKAVMRWAPRTKSTRVESIDCRRYGYAGVKLLEMRSGFAFADDKYWVDTHKWDSADSKVPFKKKKKKKNKDTKKLHTLADVAKDFSLG